jgi:predicted oxidoreductase
MSLERMNPLYEGLESGNGFIGDGVLDQCLALEMVPLAYSPVRTLPVRDDADKDAGDERRIALRAKLRDVAEQYSATPVQIALAWLTAHPAKIVPLVGTANPAHIREGAGAAKVKLSREDWFALWTAAWGHRVP